VLGLGIGSGVRVRGWVLVRVRVGDLPVLASFQLCITSHHTTFIISCASHHTTIIISDQWVWNGHSKAGRQSRGMPLDHMNAGVTPKQRCYPTAHTSAQVCLPSKRALCLHGWSTHKQGKLAKLLRHAFQQLRCGRFHDCAGFTGWFIHLPARFCGVFRLLSESPPPPPPPPRRTAITPPQK
jgi:hypothetical protein